MTSPLSSPPSHEHLSLSLQTPAGELNTSLDVSTSFIPITDLVPALRQLGEEALVLETQQAVRTGQSISCQNGCAACCRMLVPVSTPEAYDLADAIQNLPDSTRQKLQKKIDATKALLAQQDLLPKLLEISETEHPLTDAEIEPVNQAYYALRIPCPFLEEESCSIYEHRPAACRELLVTSEATLCQDIAHNPVQWLPVPLRMSTILGLLWSALVGGPLRFIPLPLALEWVTNHPSHETHRWKGKAILEEGLNQVCRFLSQEFANRGIPVPSRQEKPPEENSPS